MHAGLSFRTPNPVYFIVSTDRGYSWSQESSPTGAFAFRLIGERIDAEILLEPAGHDHTRVTLSLSESILIRTWGNSPTRILKRLYDLIQTAEP